MGWEIGKVEKDTENWKRIEKKIPKIKKRIKKI